MSVYNSLFGSLQVEILSASPSRIITSLNSAGVILYKISLIDEMTVHITIAKSDMVILAKEAEKNGDCIKILKRSGISWSLLQLKNRPILIAFILLLLLLTAFLPTRVLFMEIEGNYAINTEQILSAANACGMGFGSKTADIRSEIFKNKMLQAIPQLQWLGVNTRGCVAYISVKERIDNDDDRLKEEGNCIVAKKDGIVRSLTVTAGYPMCNIGDQIEAGQLLVAGWVELENFIRLEAAEGDIYADTECVISAITPTNYAKKAHQIGVRKKYSILIGKKLINLFKGSGIYGAGCDRIYKIYTLTLPGDFQLPLSVIQFTETEYKTEMDRHYDPDGFRWLSTYNQNYLLSQLSAGTILETIQQTEILEDVYLLQCLYRCNEMIGMKCNKEFTEEYGKRD